MTVAVIKPIEHKAAATDVNTADDSMQNGVPTDLFTALLAQLQPVAPPPTAAAPHSNTKSNSENAVKNITNKVQAQAAMPGTQQATPHTLPMTQSMAKSHVSMMMQPIDAAHALPITQPMAIPAKEITPADTAAHRLAALHRQAQQVQQTQQTQQTQQVQSEIKPAAKLSAAGAQLKSSPTLLTQSATPSSTAPIDTLMTQLSKMSQPITTPQSHPITHPQNQAKPALSGIQKPHATLTDSSEAMDETILQQPQALAARLKLQTKSANMHHALPAHNVKPAAQGVQISSQAMGVFSQLGQAIVTQLQTTAPKLSAAAVSVPLSQELYSVQIEPQAATLTEIANETFNANIKIWPPQLGQVAAKLSMNEKNASLLITTQTEAARQVVVAGLSQLQQNLADSNIHLHEVEVQTAAGQGGEAQQQRGQQQEEGQQAAGRAFDQVDERRGASAPVRARQKVAGVDTYA